MKSANRLIRLSENKEQFKHHKPERNIALRHLPLLKQEGDFGELSELKDKFRRLSVSRNIAKRPSARLKVEGSFNDVTEAKDKFRKPVENRRPNCMKYNDDHLILKGSKIGVETKTEARDKYQSFAGVNPDTLRVPPKYIYNAPIAVS